VHKNERTGTNIRNTDIKINSAINNSSLLNTAEKSFSVKAANKISV
jgi:hypothetical protein